MFKTHTLAGALISPLRKAKAGGSVSCGQPGLLSKFQDSLSIIIII